MPRAVLVVPTRSRQQVSELQRLADQHHQWPPTAGRRRRLQLPLVPARSTCGGRHVLCWQHTDQASEATHIRGEGSNGKRTRHCSHCFDVAGSCAGNCRQTAATAVQPLTLLALQRLQLLTLLALQLQMLLQPATSTLAVCKCGKRHWDGCGVHVLAQWRCRTGTVVLALPHCSGRVSGMAEGRGGQPRARRPPVGEAVYTSGPRLCLNSGCAVHAGAPSGCPTPHPRTATWV